MGLWEWAKNVLNFRSTGNTTLRQGPAHGLGWVPEESPEIHYERLHAYYKNDRVYERLASLHTYRGQVTPEAKALRNPANRVVEFYAAKLWGGSLQEAFKLEDGTSEQLTKAVEQIFEWSNWASEKQVAGRKYALFGDMFLRARQSEDGSRAYLENIDPRDVTDFDKDDTGDFTFLRLDIPKRRRAGDSGVDVERYFRTEIWNLETRTLEVYEHDKGKGASTDVMGQPQFVYSLSAQATGDPSQTIRVDRIPVAHAKFKDTGEERGASSFDHALVGIDEANVVATRLHKLLFPDWPWLLVPHGTDADQRPLPPPRLDTSASEKSESDDTTQAPLLEELHIGGEKVLRAPGNTSLDPRIPPIDFASHIAALDAHLSHLADELPELRLHKIIEQMGSNASGVALKYALSDLIDKMREAWGSGAAAIEKALGYAMKMAENVEGFAGLADEKFSFEEPEAFPLTGLEKAALEQAELQILQLKQVVLALPTSELRKEAGVPEDIAPLNAQDAVQTPQDGKQSTHAQSILTQLGGESILTRLERASGATPPVA